MNEWCILRTCFHACREDMSCCCAGQNLSDVLQMEDGGWRTQTERLLLMDSRDFNVVGIGERLCSDCDQRPLAACSTICC